MKSPFILLSLNGFFYLLVLLLFLFGAGSCKQHPVKFPVRSFYHWKTRLDISHSEKKILSELEVKKLYTRFFDIVWNEQEQMPTPVAQLVSKDSGWQGLEIVPVIFITNETLLHTDSSQILQLATNAGKLLMTLLHNYRIDSIAEIQVDCDWTESSKSNYFQLLRALRPVLDANRKSPLILSATIRLYQCKYLYKTGVPPVDRGLLMCYNMGNLKDPEATNSILTATELKKYIGSLDKYPLELDIALPLFDWMVLFKHNHYAGLIKDLDEEQFMESAAVHKKGNLFIFQKDTILKGYEFQKGDFLREEKTDYEEVIKAARLVNERLQSTHPAIILYHLDSLTLSKCTIHEMENIFNCFH